MKKYLMILFFCLIMYMAFPNMVSASQNDANIVINHYIIAYSHPAKPYINDNNRLIVPLIFVSDILGYEVNYENDILEINGLDKNIEININKNIITVNGIIYESDCFPFYDKEYDNFFIPIRIVLDAFNVEASWDNYTKTLKIEDENRFLKTEIGQYILGEDLYNSFLDNKEAFLLDSFSISLKEENDVYTKYIIEALFVNNTSEIIKEGKEDIRYFVFLNNSFIANTNKGFKERPLVNIDESVKKEIEVYLNSNSNIQDKIKYVIFCPRTINN